jgi:hypothetical protein
MQVVAPAVAVIVAGCAAASDGGFAHRIGKSAAAPCRRWGAYDSRILADRVPTLMDAKMTPTVDGGVVIAFASYRGSREFPDSRFTVLGVAASGCVRWRRSIAGGWPIAQPASAGKDAIVIASERFRPKTSTVRLGLYIVSASSGRLLRRERLRVPSATSGYQPALAGDRRGDVAAVLSLPVGLGTPTCCSDETAKLTRRALAVRFDRRIIERPGIGAPALASRPNGRMVIAYARRKHFWVRIGTVAGRLGAPIDVGRLGGNFRGGVVALAEDGTIAAAWQSGTYSRPWRLRAAVRPAGARAFALPAQLGYAAADHGTLYEGPPAALRIGHDGRITIGFFAPRRTTAGRARALCARSSATGRFAAPRPFTTDRPADPGAAAAILLGSRVSAAMMMAPPDPDELGRTLIAVGSGCRARSRHLLGPVEGHPVAAMLDAHDRVWLLTQSQPTVDSRRPLMLTVTKATG